MRKQAVFSLSDLRYVSIECPRCHTKVVLDLRTKSEFAREHDVFAPSDCPGCRVRYGTAIRPNIDALQRIYNDLTEIAGLVTFMGEPEASD